MPKEKEDFSYQVNPDFDFIIEESGNNSINFRKISWNNWTWFCRQNLCSFKSVFCSARNECI